MKPRSFSLLAALCVWIQVEPTSGDQSLDLTIQRSPAGLEISWPGTIKNPDGSLAQPYFELQRSLDWYRWQSLGERQRARSAGETLRSSVNLDDRQGFYRLLAITPTAVTKLASDGAELFGYAQAFTNHLGRIGQITLEQFREMFPSSAAYLPGISWNPLVAPNDRALQESMKWFDSQLNEAERGLLKTNGFVASERLGGKNFSDVFSKIWAAGVPVFISTDALLQAWHRTYDAMLEEIEEKFLFNSFETMLADMAAQVASTAGSTSPALRESLLDADYSLAVARSLLAGHPVPAVLDQDARVAETLTDIQNEQLKQIPDFMGFCRVIDFSQFKPRGHYTHSERLKRYFRCVMWLGRIDFPVAGGPFDRCPFVERVASPRELGAAIVLWHLLQVSGRFEIWAGIDRIIQTFVGWTDSMTFGQLNGLLAGTGIHSVADVQDLATVERIQSDIVRGELGFQNIPSDWMAHPLDGGYGLPRAFTVFGQKFILDSWAFQQNVFNRVLWSQDGTVEPVQRRVPGALDVAFSVFANNQVVPELIAQIEGNFDSSDRPHARQFRDGKPHQHNVAAVRAVLDEQRSEAWRANIYMSWLDSLRQLSIPTTDAKYPEAMRNRAWAMKTLTSQLASWTHLRHDTILYAKPSETYGFPSGGGGHPPKDLYPTGYIEPRLEFWQVLKEMARRTAEDLGTLSYSFGQPEAQTNSLSPASIQERQVNHLKNFSGIVERLETMAGKELAQDPFNADDKAFIDGWIRNGLYGQLFYPSPYLDPDDGLVADVHTDVPCPDGCGDPGSVLHEAVGGVHLLIFAAEHGPDRYLCAGPVLSHYELEVVGNPFRLSDEDWRAIREEGRLPDGIKIEGLRPPLWMRSYLAPESPN